DFLEPGDLLVVNTSATMPAALAVRADGRTLQLRLSTPAQGSPGDAWWVVELRSENGAAPNELLDCSYTGALEHGNLWHEFGDSHLLLP
ncbi:MAG TPA: hypothetical protein VLJ76_05705, partial [Gaiellaceae bacterium]|nr:hypothetical protein [Gaiellaceae bacterium]